MTETLLLLAFVALFFAGGCSQARRRFESWEEDRFRLLLDQLQQKGRD